MTMDETKKSVADLFAPPRGDSGIAYLPSTPGLKRTFNHFEAGDEKKFNPAMFAGVTRVTTPSLAPNT